MGALQMTLLRTCPRCRTPWSYGRPPARSQDILAVAMMGGFGAALGLWVGPRWGLEGSFGLVVAPVLVVIVLALVTVWTGPKMHYCQGCRRRRFGRDITLAGAMGILAVIATIFAVLILMQT
jgi:hypothetical protein